MNKKVSACLILSIAFLISCVSFSYALDWELIGQIKVAEKANKVDFAIGNKKALYTQLRFGVQTAPIKIIKIIASPADGEEIEIESKSYIRPGENSPPILLSGEGIALNNVRLIYYTKKWVTVELYGIKTTQGKTTDP